LISACELHDFSGCELAWNVVYAELCTRAAQAYFETGKIIALRKRGVFDNFQG
jgi:hypothetical protein